MVFSCIISVMDEREEAACWMIEVSPGPLFFIISSQFFHHFTLLSDTKIAPVLYSLFPHDAFKVSAASGAFSGPLCVCVCVCVWLQWLVVPSGCRCVISHQLCSQLYKQRVLPAAGSLHRPGTESFVVNYWEKWSDC